MRIKNQELINDLIKRTEINRIAVENLKAKSVQGLNQRQHDKAWSALECVEHLNRYSLFYLPEIEKQIAYAKSVNKHACFKSGILGNVFAKSLSATPKTRKMKTFENMNPLGSKLKVSLLDQFLNDQDRLIEILQKAEQVNLTKTKTAVSISKRIKLRLGDTFRVLVYHNERHIEQAKRAVN